MRIHTHNICTHISHIMYYYISVFVFIRRRPSSPSPLSIVVLRRPSVVVRCPSVVVRRHPSTFVVRQTSFVIRLGLATLCSPDHLFSPLDRRLAPSDPNVCSFILDFVCIIRKLLQTLTETKHSVIIKILLSFSLLFPIAFKAFYKLVAKRTDVYS